MEAASSVIPVIPHSMPTATQVSSTNVSVASTPSQSKMNQTASSKQLAQQPQPHSSVQQQQQQSNQLKQHSQSQKNFQTQQPSVPQQAQPGAQAQQKNAQQSHGHVQAQPAVQYMQPRQASSTDSSNADQLTLRALVGMKEAGIVIGKLGSNIRRIRELSGAKVVISPHVPGVSERILSITGISEEIAKAYAQVARNLNQGDLRGTSPETVESTPLTVRFLIPNSRMGGLIGRSGSRIKEIQEESNARLIATQAPLPNSGDRVLEMIGVPDAIHIATYHMLDTIKSLADRPCYDRAYRPESTLSAQRAASGMGAMSPGAQGNSAAAMVAAAAAAAMYPSQHTHPQQSQQQHAQHQYGAHNSVAARYGGNSQHSQQQQHPAYAQQMQYQSHHLQQQHQQHQQHLQQHASQHQQHVQSVASAAAAAAAATSGPQETRSFICPAHKVGPMIGKHGLRINSVRGESFCKINIEDPGFTLSASDLANAAGISGSASGVPDRVFTVTGHPQNIEIAMRLLEANLRRELARDTENQHAAGGDAALAAAGPPAGNI